MLLPSLPGFCRSSEHRRYSVSDHPAKGMLGAFSRYAVHKLLRTTCPVQSYQPTTASYLNQKARFFWPLCFARTDLRLTRSSQEPAKRTRLVVSIERRAEILFGSSRQFSYPVISGQFSRRIDGITGYELGSSHQGRHDRIWIVFGRLGLRPTSRVN